jgi:hypothetical protein
MSLIGLNWHESPLICQYHCLLIGNYQHSGDVTCWLPTSAQLYRSVSLVFQLYRPMKIGLIDNFDIGGAWKILIYGKLLLVFILISATLFLLFLSKLETERLETWKEFLFNSSTAKKNYWTVGPGELSKFVGPFKKLPDMTDSRTRFSLDCTSMNSHKWFTSMNAHQCSYINVSTSMSSHQCLHINVFTSMSLHQCLHINVFTSNSLHPCPHIHVLTSMSSHQFEHRNIITSMSPNKCLNINFLTALFSHQLIHLMSTWQ